MYVMMTARERRTELTCTVKARTGAADACSMHWFKTLGVSVVALVVADACADSTARNIGKALVDAGEMMGGRAAPAHKPDAGSVYEAGSGGGSGDDGSPSVRRDAGSSAGGTSGDRDASMLADAGQMLVDAGKAMIDAGREQVRDAQADTPSSTNGTRIKIRRTVHMGADGTRLADVPNYYDQQLQSDCVVYPASDGVQRCMPILNGGVWAPNIPGYLFGDAQCSTAPLLYTTGCEPVPYAYGFGSMPTSCQTAVNVYRVYRVGAQHTGSIYSNIGGTCVAYPKQNGQRYYVIGSEVTPNEMVEFTTSVELVP